MNFKLVLKAYSTLRQLSDDESALLATLRGMNDSERELLVESLQPERKVSKPATTRTVEKCGADGCDYTRRAAVHKDPNADGYHEFQPPKPVEKTAKKSARATGLAATLNKNLAQQRKPMCATCGNEKDHEDHGDGPGQHPFDTNVGSRLQKLMGNDDANGPQCTYEIDGKVCKGLAGDGIHDATLGYVNYHEFVGPVEAVATGGAQ